ncbi:hypothetical protein ES707_01152 [subsurface metagenome]
MVGLKRTKEEIIKKAEELAVEYEAKYKGCGQCTFLAIIDALRWGGGWKLFQRIWKIDFFPGYVL